MTAMYQGYFGLVDAPFSIAPTPRYLYMSRQHQEALAHLLYGLEGDGGFVLLTGEVGTGKTTVCRSLLDQLPESCDLAYIFNPKLTVAELLSTICTEFGIDCPPDNASVKVFVDRINAHLLDLHARGRHAVLIIDEAQNLSADVLEQMRLLTNLETDRRKLLQIVLIGQPELAALLERPELRQLAQRIVARYHLGPLTRQEVAAYVRHRLDVAGSQRLLFPERVVGRLYRLSGGIPRVINLLCDRALLGAYAQGKERVDRATLAQAAREVLGNGVGQHAALRQLLIAGLLLAAGALAVFLHRPPPPATGHATSPQVLLNTVRWPAGVARPADDALAYAALFKAWGARYGSGDPCQQATALGLRCKNGLGSLAVLRKLDRPAVLQMQDAAGQAFAATLIALGPGSARLVVGGKTVEVSLGALANQWSGRYNLFWRAPPAVQGVLRLGDRGPAVAWLRDRLARLDGHGKQPTGEPVFDAGLEREVKHFQLTHGLVPDGHAGPNTLIRLATLANATAPSLTKQVH